MNDLDWELLDRYLAGVATPAERQQFELWVGAEPDRAAVLEALRKALAGVERDVTPEELEAVWQGVANRTGLSWPAPSKVLATFEVNGPDERGMTTTQSTSWWSQAKWAAVLALVIGGLLIARHLWTGVDGKVSDDESVVTVPRGQRVQLRLPDGSQVLLGAGSTLRHSKAYGEGVREVLLEGQAYFTVQHEEDRPFQVRATNLVATDLGTEFLVQAYPEQDGAKVVVRSGQVIIRPAATAFQTHTGGVVGPGEIGRISGDGAPAIGPADTAAYFAWITGTLVFDATPLREAIPQLSRWYDLDFRLADSTLDTLLVSGRLDQTLTHSRLDLIAASLGLEQVRQGNVVTFYRAGTVLR